MKRSNQSNMIQRVKEARWEDWSNSLITSRADGSTDAILICQEKKYPAHRFVLEMSSSYFKTMFQSGLKESKSRVVRFKSLQPETLEAILDYLYEGKVDMIKTEVQIKNVLSASHMMNLTKLFEYCCFMLGESLSKDNFYEIQQIVSTYENITLNEKMLAFVAVYGTENVGMNAFQDLSVDQMKTMLSFAKIKRLCFDKLLTVLVHWLQYDLKSREKEARELFGCVDGQLVSKSTISSLLVDDKISSEIISQLLKDVALACTLGFDASSKRMEVLRKELNITFFNLSMEYERYQTGSYFIAQQFNVNTMTWLPPEKTDLSISGNITGASLCCFSGTVHMLGGSLSKQHLLYDIANNEVELRKRSSDWLNGLTGLGLCVFKNKLYVVGGKRNDGTIQNLVYCTVLGSADNWVSAPSMNVQRFLPTVLTTSDCIYAVGGYSSLNTFSAEYLKAKARYWTVINCASVPRSVSSRHCLVFNNKLHAVGLSNGQFECWVLNCDLWHYKYSVQAPSHCTNIVNVCQFPSEDMEVILLSVRNPCLPTHAWKPFEGKLKELESVSGLCEIPNYSCKQYLCFSDL